MHSLDRGVFGERELVIKPVTRNAAHIAVAELGFHVADTSVIDYQQLKAFFDKASADAQA